MTKDLFSKQADAYSAYRPLYPPELYAWLVLQTPRPHHLAWDVGTGNGQVAAVLAQHFERVLATDLSAAQLAKALQVPNITYRQALAKASGLDDSSTDLVCVAQAMHWFDLDLFYPEVDRVLRPGGLFAAWGYKIPESETNPGFTSAFFHCYKNILGPYWDPERRLVEESYASMPFPYEKMATPDFSMRATWTAKDAAGYIASWSALQNYRAALQEDPLPAIEALLTEQVPPGTTVDVFFPMFVVCGRKV